MACGKPLVQYIDRELYQTFYGDVPPIANAKTEDEIYNILLRIIDEPRFRKKIGNEARNWLLKHHNHEKIIKKYLYLYDAIKNKKDFQTIKETISSM